MTLMGRKALAREALAMSISVRRGAGIDLESPLDIYALCDQLGIPFRFVDISMEGMYQRVPSPYILISALRPAGRRAFTCAHELGHHLFGHGSTIDELLSSDSDSKTRTPEEYLVDTFAGFLLMPLLGVRSAYTIRGLKPATARPEDHYVIAGTFSVGYTTIVNHLAYSTRSIESAAAKRLAAVPLPRIRRAILGEDLGGPLLVVDQYWALPTVDAEVGTYVLFKAEVAVNGSLLEPVAQLTHGWLFKAVRPGIARIRTLSGTWTAFARVSRKDYVGLGRYRHLEEDDDTQ